jgi:glycosyltransferase involved in cell wall biosynthesis
LFLERTLASVLDQQYPRLEYIVQDGGSRDGTPEILKRYSHRLHRAISAPDRGQTNALNLGFAHASGEILAYLNSDDVLLPGSLHYVIRYFQDHPDVDVVYGHRVFIDSDDHEVGRWVLPPHSDSMLVWADYVPQETMFWRRRIWEAIGAHFDESFQFAMDWDLLLRFRQAHAKMVRLPRFLGAFRVHDEQKSQAQLASVGAREMTRLRRRSHGRDVDRREIRRGILGYLVQHAVCDRLYRLGLLRY